MEIGGGFMSYELVGWENKPSTKTAVGATNLKHMDNGIKDAHDFIDSLPEWLKEGGKPNYTAEEVGAYSKEQTDKLLYAKANAIKNSAQGETILTTDSANAPLVDMTVYGKSKQNTVGGNQLAYFPNKEEEEKLGIKWSCKDGVITAVGTTSETASSPSNGLGIYYDLPLGTVGTFYISGTSSDGKCEVFVWVQNSSGVNSYKRDQSFTLDGTEKLVRVYAQVPKNTTANCSVKPMLNTGTTKKDWEPYVGNKPSPSIDYPQEIVSHGDKGSIEYGLYGGNLYDGEVKNGMVTSTGEVNLNQSNVYLGFSKKVKCVGGRRYTIKCFGYSSTSNYNVGIWNGDLFIQRYSVYQISAETSVDTVKNISSCSFVVPNDINATDMFIYIYDNNSPFTDLSVYKFVISLDDNINDYEPYTKQPLTILTPNGMKGIPLGTTIPSVIANSEIHMRGVWFDKVEQQYYISDTREYGRGKDVQRIGKYIPSEQLNQVSNGGLGASSDTILCRFNVGTNRYTLNGKSVICNALNRYNGNMWNGLDVESFFISSDGYLDFRINRSRLTEQTINGVKQYCSEINMYFFYLLQEPTETDIPSEEMEQYNALMMNYPNTTILNDENAYTEVEYVADTKCYIDNKFKELETNVTSAVAQLL